MDLKRKREDDNDKNEEIRPPKKFRGNVRPTEENFIAFPKWNREDDEENNENILPKKLAGENDSELLKNNKKQ